MRRVRISVGWLLFAVALTAVDCALLRSRELPFLLFTSTPGTVLSDCFTGGRDHLSVIRFTSLVLLGDILAAGLYRILTRRGEAHPFLVGFELSGLAGVLFLFVLPGPASRAVGYAYWRLYDFLLVWPVVEDGPGNPYYHPLTFMILIVIPAVLLTVPLLAMALIGGWLRRRIA